jgi:hypothetical protein
MLLSMKSQTDAARAIALYGALQLDLGRHHPEASTRAAAQARGELLIPIIKGWSTELGVQLTSLGIQVHGGMGYIEETGAAQYYRDVRITPIYEGTTGIQAIDLVGRKVARDGAAAMNGLIAEMTMELRESSATDSEVCVEHAAVLKAIERLKSATDTVLRLSAIGAEHTQAIAVPYLTLCGVVIGGWLITRAHELAVQSINEDRDFYASKQQTARFYLQHVLPQSLALEQQIAHGAAIVVADPAFF